MAEVRCRSRALSNRNKRMQKAEGYPQSVFHNNTYPTRAESNTGGSCLMCRGALGCVVVHPF